MAGAAAAPDDEALAELRERVDRVSDALGRRIKILVGKPGLDGHSNGAEQIAVRARDAGMDVLYEGIRLTPQRIAQAAVQEGVHVVGLSILSGSHAELIPSVLRELREAGADVPVVVGGIIPPRDERALLEAGVARVYTPKDFEISRIMGDVVELVAEHHGVAVAARAMRAPSSSRATRPRTGLSPDRDAHGADGAALGRRLRERDLTAAPAALNLLEQRAGAARTGGGRAASGGVPARAGR